MLKKEIGHKMKMSNIYIKFSFIYNNIFFSIIFARYLEHGSSWSKIAKNLDGRTENAVKNRFYSTVRKLLSDVDKDDMTDETSLKHLLRMKLE